MDHPILSLEETKQVYLELLQELDRLLKANNLRYDLAGGTLLGAVRHKGFIPWDNDIDINMPRPDYERLLELSQAGKLEMPAHRSVVMDRDQSFPRHFARYVRHDVMRVPDMAEDWDCPYIGIDIFPIDGLPADDGAFKRQVWQVRQLRRLLLTSVERPNTSRRGKLAAKIKNLYRPILRKIGPFTLAAKLDEACARMDYGKAEYVGGISGMYGKRERWRKSDMLPQIHLEFEGLKFPAYANYDIYLSNLYGDYMQLPPADKQVPHCDPCYRVEVED